MFELDVFYIFAWTCKHPLVWVWTIFMIVCGFMYAAFSVFYNVVSFGIELVVGTCSSLGIV